jgi:hypothetical protein
MSFVIELWCHLGEDSTSHIRSVAHCSKSGEQYEEGGYVVVAAEDHREWRNPVQGGPATGGSPHSIASSRDPVSEENNDITTA